MELWKILTIVGTVCLLAPFFIWQIIRWRERVKQIFAHWHKLTIIISFSIGIALAIVCYVLAFVL